MGKAEAVRSAITRLADALASVVVAPECAACARVLEAPCAGPVCEACWGAIVPVVAPFCVRCGDPLPSWRVLSQTEGVCARCRRRPPAFDRGRAAGEYEGSLRAIIHAFKYDGRPSLAGPLGTLMRREAGDLLHDAHCVVPVPLHPWRRMRRGFNQAAELGKRLGPPLVHGLWRARATAPQTGLTARERRRNVRGAFVISPLLGRAGRARWIDRRSVVLVDDVRTTGATLEMCAQVLKQAGAAEVRVLTIARAAPPRP